MVWLINFILYVRDIIYSIDPFSFWFCAMMLGAFASGRLTYILDIKKLNPEGQFKYPMFSGFENYFFVNQINYYAIIFIILLILTVTALRYKYLKNTFIV